MIVLYSHIRVKCDDYTRVTKKSDLYLICGGHILFPTLLELYYFLSKLLNLKLAKVCTLKIPHCVMIVIKEDNLSSKTIPMHLIHHMI